MELEFDKEIDAILRKSRSGIGAITTNADHLDADTIAAFAENALPDKAKPLYIKHFADCDRCRKQLSFVIQMNKEAAATAAAAPVAEPVVETSIPWYQSFLKTPNLALAMGALVLVFSGVLGYLVMQKQNAEQSATVSQVTDTEKARGGPNFNEEETSNAAAPLSEFMATANPTAPPSNMAANAEAQMPGDASGLAGRTDADTSKSDQAHEKNFQVDGASGSENTFIVDGQETTDVLTGKNPSAAAPPARTGQYQTDGISSQNAELLPKGLNMSSVLKTDKAAGAATELDEKKPSGAGKLKEERKDDDQLEKKQNADRNFRDMPRAAAKRAGPVQNLSNQINNQSSEMAVSRSVGGKTFNNHDGAWYDSAYHGQTTVNFRRGTVEYKKLDSGLRSIADTLGGTIVVVWKAKACRIQ